MDLPLCECGCEERVSKPGNRFVRGHNFYGKTHSAETKRQLAKLAKGRKLSESHKRKISKALRGKPHSAEHKRRIGDAHKGKRHSAEWRRRSSEAQKGKTHSAETRRKMSEARKGKPHSAEHTRKVAAAHKGKKVSAETRRKMSGENNPNWRGGKSFEGYGPEFNGALKRAIRERDGFVCQLCGAPENGLAHDCHHIDYDKLDSCLANLITLCHSCHSKTNVNNRAFWMKLFQTRMKMGLT